MKRMRMFALLALAGLALLMTAAACSDDEDDEPQDSTPGVEADADTGEETDANAGDADADAGDADADNASDADADNAGDADSASGDDASDDDADGGAADGGAITASIVGFAFEAPAQVTAGAVISWTNNDPVVHTVTARSGAFDSGTIAADGTFDLTLAEAGSVEIFCTVHPSMTATIEVVEG